MGITMFSPAPRYFERQKWCNQMLGRTQRLLWIYVCWHLEKNRGEHIFLHPTPKKIQSRVFKYVE